MAELEHAHDHERRIGHSALSSAEDADAGTATDTRRSGAISRGASAR
jgi:hypothetical protein